jgi:nucleoside-diphosphate-sugar epimerase
MRVLIIGGTGLISTSITKSLLQGGADVVHMNRGLAARRFEGNVQVIECDRNSEEFTDKLRAGAPYDVVIDMVCYHPDQAAKLIDACKGSTRQIIFCSTVDVYAKPSANYPVTESSLIASRTGYGRNKAACEDLIFAAAKSGAFEATIIRPSCTYGEGGVLVHTFGWSTSFLSRLEAGLPVVVFGDGTSLWSWLHVDDCGEAFATACMNSAAYGRAFHVASSEWLTWDASVQTIATALGAPDPNIVHIPIDVLQQVIPNHSAISWENFSWPNIYNTRAAEEILNLQARISFPEGATRTIGWLKENGGFESIENDKVTDELVRQYQAACQTIKVAE